MIWIVPFLFCFIVYLYSQILVINISLRCLKVSQECLRKLDEIQEKIDFDEVDLKERAILILRAKCFLEYSRLIW